MILKVPLNYSKNNNKKHKDLNMIAISIILRIQLFFFLQIFPTDSNLLNGLNYTYQESYSFYYEKYDLLTLNGQTVTSKTPTVKSGKIDFFKETVKITQGGKIDSYKVTEAFKKPGGYQLNCIDPNGRRCLVGVISRNGINYVLLHYPADGKMTMFEIQKGFTTEIKFFN